MSTKKNSSEPPKVPQNFPIVGVGASAGGLDAFKQFLIAIPPLSGMAYVLVQHLDPSHQSILPEILSKVTTIPVNEITDDINLAPNNIYVIPENKILTSTDGILNLSPRNKLKTNAAIDVFFTTLAEVHKNLAIGVVLSGRGNDGTSGLKAIKLHGGVTFAQSLESAAYRDMPQNAINADTVDFILPPSEIPAKLVELFQQKKHTKKENLDIDNDRAFDQIINVLRQHSGVDFTSYKQTTIRRRIARRMAMSKTETFSDYLEFLQSDSTAPEALFYDLLIPVTSFFRDPKIFQTLRENVLPILAKNRSETNCIRIWTAGCSTGEEAYSLAISMNEFLGENLTGTQIQVFASDISEMAIAKARIGFFTKSQLANVSEGLLKKYFIKTNTGYQINRQIRDMCVFAVHNFLRDPPFAKMDLITCRNVLIYMDLTLQKRALSTFHYAIKEGGFLMLGKSETTASAEDLFLPFAKSGKIYTRKEVSGNFRHTVIEKNKESAASAKKTAKPKAIKADFLDSAELLLLSKYTPASVIVNEHMDIVHISGAIGPFLESPQGKPTYNLLKMARQGLSFELRTAFFKTKETEEAVTKAGISIKIDGKNTDVTIEVIPIPDSGEPHFLVLFYHTPYLEKEIAISNLSIEDIHNDANLRRIRQLENELALLQKDVQAITEDQEASNEELQSANEELLSGSEELQSLNEELETSKEELQSSNEELIIINQELINKQELINISRDYTEAIVATLREPIVVLDTELRIKNINRSFIKKFQITKQEAEGKMIYEIQNHLFDNPVMRTLLEEVLTQQSQLDDYEITVNLQPYGESTMLLNARQVTTEKSNELLILLAIEDITERKQSEQQLRDFSDDLELKVSERTAALVKTNAELKNAIKETTRANIKLQQFAYIASHDLQEPLRKILMFTSRLQEYHNKLPANAVALLEKVSSSSDRMKTLIHDLLEYSYLSNQDESFVPTDLNMVLSNIVSDFELLIEDNKAVINICALPTITAIPLQMNQLFYNLMSNALKFCCPDKRIPVIDVTIKNMPKSEIAKYPALNHLMPYCEIIFKDNGIGFEQQYEKQIFTIFQRLHSNDTYIGTGIGLAISKKIIENHNGEIFAKAIPDEGASFHIVLPLDYLSDKLLKVKL